MTATQSRLGFALKHDFVAGKQAWSVDTRAYWLYDFGGNTCNLTAAYAMWGPNAQSFELVDSGFSESSVWLDIGVLAEFNEQFSGRLSYRGQFCGNYSAQTISAELLMRF